MIKSRQKIISVIVVLIFGFVLLYAGTDEFTAFTSETARVNGLIENKPEFPAVTLEDSEIRTYTFSEFKDKYVFITFMYTYCSTVCPKLEMNMSHVYSQIPQKYLGDDIVFLSISFDPARDTSAALDKYKGYFNSDGETWRMARIPDKKDLEMLLKEFGVIVIPDGFGNFTHNSAFYLVNKKGKLIDVMDYKKVDEAAQKVLTILKETGE
ncbi:SCO family protein [Pseudalkalibacillus caeni]|uniref:SCO family protein n=1 Tax=Exobacillus caeni TaxID=2574798 RepID=A0A5R9F7M3_9BACL|nr:SCO family protein [Pseudalkalibacillus caeni]TLS36843.1 SCO family protein [Pseudalkalibacillus caeni]